MDGASFSVNGIFVDTPGRAVTFLGEDVHGWVVAIVAAVVAAAIWDFALWLISKATRNAKVLLLRLPFLILYLARPQLSKDAWTTLHPEWSVSCGSG